MNVLLSTIGQRGYLARYFREALPAGSLVIGTGNSAHTSGFSSCDRSVVVPDIGANGYLDRVLEIVDEHDVGAVLTLSDADVAVLPALRPELERRGVAAFFPDPRQAAISLDKVETGRFAAGLGLTAPATTTDGVEATAWGPPLFVKPRAGSASVDAFVARTSEDIRFFMARRADMIAQELIDGVEVNVEVCCDLEGLPVRACVWRKHESRRGETLSAETVVHDAALAAGLTLARHLRAPGPMDIDMMLVDDRPVIIEINSRFGGGYPMSHLAGADFVRALVDLAAGVPVEPDFRYEPGLFMMKDLQPFAYPARTAAGPPTSVPSTPERAVGS